MSNREREDNIERQTDTVLVNYLIIHLSYHFFNDFFHIVTMKNTIMN